MSQLLVFARLAARGKWGWSRCPLVQDEPPQLRPLLVPAGRIESDRLCHRLCDTRFARDTQMQPSSRHANLYGELWRRREPTALLQPDVLGNESYFVDIADGDFGNVRISCWPTPESFRGGRRWGRFGSTKVGIVPFRTKAELTSDTVGLSVFEVELYFREIGPQGLIPESYRELCHGQQCQRRPHSSISLVNLPAPTNIAPQQILPVSTTVGTGTTRKPWRFRSNSVKDCDGQARTARWTWDTNGHKPVVLYGGVALQHEGDPFLIACRARGKAYIKKHRYPRIRIPLDFSYRMQPKWWKLVPQNGHADLSTDIQNLDGEMQDLNMNSGKFTSADSSQQRSASRGHDYEHVKIGGHAKVIVGSGSFGSSGQNPRSGRGMQGLDPRSNRGTEQLDPRSGRRTEEPDPHLPEGEVPRGMEQMMRPQHDVSDDEEPE